MSICYTCGFEIILSSIIIQEEKLKKKHRYVLKELETIQGEMEVHYSFNVKINCGIPKLSKYIEDRLNARQVCDYSNIQINPV